MAFQEIMDSIIKARADVIHAGRLLAQWDLRKGRHPEANEFALLKSLIGEANNKLDSIVSRMVGESARTDRVEEEIPSARLRRRPGAHRSRLS